MIPIDDLESPEFNQFLSLFQHASRHVDIVSQALDAPLFQHTAFLESLTALAKRGRHSRIRILIADLARVQKRGYRLLRLHERMPTTLHIRVLEEFPGHQATTFVIDGAMALSLQERLGRIYRHERGEARRRQLRFEQLWYGARVPEELRQL